VWELECKRWRPDYTPITPKRFQWPKANELVILNYEKAIPEGWPNKLTVCVFDECLAVKNKSMRGNRARIIRDACIKADGRCVALSGTPIETSPEDLQSLLEFLYLFEKSFGTRKKFLECFNSSVGYGGVRMWGKATEECKQIIKQYILYKSKADIMPYLPRVTAENLEVKLEDKKAIALCNKFQSYVKDLGYSIESYLKSSLITSDKAFFALRKELARVRIPYTLEYIELLEKLDEKVLVFSAHREPIEAFKNRPGWEIIYGDVPANKRTEICKAFRENKLKGVALTIRCGQYAIDLANADRVVMVDQDWNPPLNVQACSRALGPNQKRPVLVQRMFSDHSVDRDMFKIINNKETTIESLFPGSAVL
jgi:SNF2 family DNA or RNA helicase